MFTGIIQEKGIVKKIVRKERGYSIVIKANIVGKDLNVGGSIAVNGVCLSLVKKKDLLVFDIVLNTYKNTNLKRLKPGSVVNLEEALKAGDDISGHIVSGHVDTERKVLKNQKLTSGWILDIEFLSKDKGFIVPKGSIAIDGISLTIGELARNYFRTFIIPHTLENSTLFFKKSGDYVNVEFDVMAKYGLINKNIITKDFLVKRGFGSGD